MQFRHENSNPDGDTCVGPCLPSVLTSPAEAAWLPEAQVPVATHHGQNHPFPSQWQHINRLPPASPLKAWEKGREPSVARDASGRWTAGGLPSFQSVSWQIPGSLAGRKEMGSAAAQPAENSALCSQGFDPGALGHRRQGHVSLAAERTTCLH